jgi:TPR repeat protein
MHVAAAQQALASSATRSDLTKLLSLAGRGDPGSQLPSAIYEFGQGAPQDYQEALKWYRLAADQGNALAHSARENMPQSHWPCRCMRT